MFKISKCRFDFKLIGKFSMIKKKKSVPPYTIFEGHVRGNKLFKGWPKHVLLYETFISIPIR